MVFEPVDDFRMLFIEPVHEHKDGNGEDPNGNSHEDCNPDERESEEDEFKCEPRDAERDHEHALPDVVSADVEKNEGNLVYQR